MKVLSIQQPWATLICHGIKNIENRSWKPQEIPEKILIHASKACTARCINQMPLEWAQDVLNEVKFGNVPDFKEMPSGAIIGYVTIERIDHKTNNSIWACAGDDDPDNYYWHLKDAFVFDEPITGIKGKLRLWNYDLDESALPAAHQVELYGYFCADSDTIAVPVSNGEFKSVKENGHFEFDLDTYAQEVCEDGKCILKPFKKIIFCAEDGEKRTFELTHSEAAHQIDDNGDAVLFPSLYDKDGQPRFVATFKLGKEVK